MSNYSSSAYRSSLFAIRGDLDGSKKAEAFIGLKQFIGFIVENEEFLLPMTAMKEIIMLNRLTFVPGGPKFVDGVINLRGTILPAICLRTMMGHDQCKPSPANRIIITNHESVMAGLIVDAITYVISLNAAQIEASNVTNLGKGFDLLMGISKRGNKVNGILDIVKVFNATDYRQRLSEEEIKDTGL
ncbi:MAG: chemotaxis protein CheW [Oligoflexales bacterium]